MLEPRYVQFSDPASFVDCAKLCVNLSGEYRDLAESLGYPDLDARGVALRNASHWAGAAAMVLNVLDSGSRSAEDAVRALLGVTTGPLQVACDDLEQFARLALLTLVQFQIENLLTNLVRALGLSPKRQYAQLIDQALGAFRGSAVQRPRTSLLVPGWIRNTLHNNGIHEGRDRRVQVHGHRFTFRRGRRFSQAGWGEVAHVLRAELRTVERLLHSRAARGLSAPVLDRYAAVAGTETPTT